MRPHAGDTEKLVFGQVGVERFGQNVALSGQVFIA